ncbi:hypothetical protein [Homoserinibacter sp. YIM 151385]|uniref:hypothetical protein n=1 Tax=Homoserinibacter sp. YIM 151385 TaxID=2985506 RepID=UPI0022EFFEF3|nr:hypothetical protein [Homoserinibacter sp. YIM 151385]WBU38859.1 hypothetical protein OF852_04565 [Homoserinibacter sp. YIM 151385]
MHETSGEWSTDDAGSSAPPERGSMPSFGSVRDVDAAPVVGDPAPWLSAPPPVPDAPHAPFSGEAAAASPVEPADRAPSPAPFSAAPHAATPDPAPFGGAVFPPQPTPDPAPSFFDAPPPSFPPPFAAESAPAPAAPTAPAVHDWDAATFAAFAAPEQAAPEQVAPEQIAPEPRSQEPAGQAPRAVEPAATRPAPAEPIAPEPAFAVAPPEPGRMPGPAAATPAAPLSPPAPALSPADELPLETAAMPVPLEEPASPETGWHLPAEAGAFVRAPAPTEALAAEEAQSLAVFDELFEEGEPRSEVAAPLAAPLAPDPAPAPQPPAAPIAAASASSPAPAAGGARSRDEPAPSGFAFGLTPSVEVDDGRPTQADRLSVVFSLLLPPIGVVYSATRGVMSRRRRGFVPKVVAISAVLGVVMSGAAAAGGAVAAGAISDQLAHDEVVRASAAFCGAVEQDPSLLSADLGWPAVEGTVRSSIRAMDAFGERWTAVAAISPEPVAAAATQVADAGAAIRESVAASRTIEDAANRDRMSALAARGTLVAWQRSYCP